MDRIAALGEMPPMLASRLRFLREADRSVIGTIRCGVLFVMAFWSGPCRSAFAELKRVIAAEDCDGRLELVVVDTDGCPDLQNQPEFTDKLAGAGEIAWVMDGVIVCTSGQGYHPECFGANTRRLLRECTASGTG